MRRWPVSVIMALVLATSCTHRAAESTRGSDQIITEEEIAGSQATNAYEAVSKLRANFLSNRGRVTVLDPNSSPLPVVYVDGTLYGDLSTLRGIPVSQVSSIRLYRSWEAQQKFGNGKLGGVIEVVSKR
jgi:hypothetical protein